MNLAPGSWPWSREILAFLAGITMLGASPTWGQRAASFPLLLPRGKAAYFVQDNLVNSRLLELQPGGTYRQIDVDHSSSAETDRGTWEQDTKGAVLLHPSCAGMRFRALCSGPLTIVLDRPAILPVLPLLAAAMRRFLDESEDEVFARGGIAEIQANFPQATLSIDPQAETFSRAELISLAHQIDDLLWSERTNTYILSPVTAASPPLLVLQDALFQSQDLALVRQEYRVGPGKAPPFYFARVDGRTFARMAGRWKVLHLPGQPD